MIFYLCIALFTPLISNLLAPLCSTSFFSLFHYILLQSSLLIPLSSDFSTSLCSLLNSGGGATLGRGTTLGGGVTLEVGPPLEVESPLEVALLQLGREE